MSYSPSCPVCKAANAVGPSCRRCKADLTLMVALEHQRDCALEAGRQAYRAGHTDEALAWIRRADQLRRGDDSQSLLLALWLLRRDYLQGSPCPKLC